MSDLVERLRENPVAYAETAAKELERLRAELSDSNLAGTMHAAMLLKEQEEVKRLRAELADAQIRADAADLRANRLCAAVDALEGGELLPISGGWVDGFRSAIKKLRVSISGSPDNYLDHCLAVARNRAERLRAERDGADAAFELVQADCDRLRAELAAAQKDAERYRWPSKNRWSYPPRVRVIIDKFEPQHLDQEVDDSMKDDAALAKEKS